MPHCRRLDGPGGALLAAQREVRAAAGPEQGGCLVQEVCDQHAVASRVRRLVGQAAIAEVWIVKNDVVVQPGRVDARAQSRGIDAVPDGRLAPFKLSRVGCSVSVGGDQLLGGGQYCRCQLDHTAEGTLQCERVREVAVAHDKDSAPLNGLHARCERAPSTSTARNLFGGLTSARPLGRRSMRELQRRGWRCPDEQRSLPPYHCCRPAFEVRLHPGIIPRRTDKNVCRFFGAPPRLAACRVFPDNLITYFTCQYADGGGAGVLSPGGRVLWAAVCLERVTAALVRYHCCRPAFRQYTTRTSADFSVARRRGFPDHLIT